MLCIYGETANFSGVLAALYCICRQGVVIITQPLRPLTESPSTNSELVPALLEDLQQHNPHRALCPALHPQRHCWLCWGQRWAATAPAPHPHLLIWVGVWLLEGLKGSQGKQLTKNTTLFYRATMLTHTQSFLRETKPSAVLILLFGCISKVCMSYLGLFIN